MTFWRDRLGLGLAAVVAAGLAALTIVPVLYPAGEPLGYLGGTVLSYEVRVSKLGGTTGTFNLRLDGGEVLQVAATKLLVPGKRVCVRASRRGTMIEGVLVSADHCAQA